MKVKNPYTCIAFQSRSKIYIIKWQRNKQSHISSHEISRKAVQNKDNSDEEEYLDIYEGLDNDGNRIVDKK